MTQPGQCPSSELMGDDDFSSDDVCRCVFCETMLDENGRLTRLRKPHMGGLFVSSKMARLVRIDVLAWYRREELAAANPLC